MACHWRSAALFLTILLALGGMPQPAIPETPPASGDWDITTDTVVDNVTATLNGNLTVHSGATLTVTNSSLSFDYSGYNWAGWPLSVEKGAALVMKDSIVSPAGQSKSEWFFITGRAEFSGSKFNNTYIEVIDADGCNIADCNFSAGGVTTERTNTTVRNSTFIISNWGGLGVTGGNVTISGCSFFSETELDIEHPPLQPSAGFRSNSTCINNNLFVDIGDRPIYMLTTSQGSGNPAPAIIHVDIESGAGLLIERNIFSKFGNGIAAYCWDWATNVPAMISNNTFSGSWVGANIVGQQDCSVMNNSFFGNTVGLDFQSQGREISGNTFQDCKLGIVNLGGPNQNISNNEFLNCSTGIAMQSAWNNTISNNDFTGCSVSVSHSHWSYLPYESEGLRMTGNRISNGTLGANLTYFTGEFSGNEITNCTFGADMTNFSGMVSENRISDCTSYGLVAWNRTTPGSDLSVSRNTLENCGMFISDRSNRTIDASGNTITGAPFAGIEVEGHANITRNNISGSPTGVRLSSDYFNESATDASDNAFDNITAFCVHAIGTAIGPGNNTYTDGCEGRILQEWWLLVNVTDGAQRPVPDASISVTGAAGGPAKNWTGGDMYVNVSAYLIDKAGYLTLLNPNIITAEKPGTGIARATLNVTGNTRLNLTIRPHPDLYIDLFQPQAGRLQAAKPVMVDVIIGADRTYLQKKTDEISPNVMLKADGQVVSTEYVTIPGTGAFGSHKFWWLAEGGNHTLSVVVDPANNIAEYDEWNNEMSMDIDVNALPKAVLNVSTRSARAGEDITFSAEGSSDDMAVEEYNLELGDGTTTGWTGTRMFTHHYFRAGSYNATLLVRDNEGAVSGRAAVVRLDIAPYPPDVELRADKAMIESGGLVQFTAVIFNPNIDITSIIWDFGDGKSESGLEASTGHLYLRSGVFTAKVTVLDSQGQRGSSSVDIVVRNKLPEASFTFTPENCTIETELTFSSAVKDPDGRVLNWLWQFGDGTCSTEAEPRHRFQRKGNFTVTLRVQDDSGDWSFPAESVVRIGNLPPRARATFTPPVAIVGELVTFYASCSTDPDDPFSALQFCWSSADGWHLAGLSAQRKFSSPGEHTVMLAVSDQNGATDTTEVVITVKSRPVTVAAPSGGIAAVSAIALLLVAAAVLYYLKRSGRLRPER